VFGEAGRDLPTRATWEQTEGNTLFVVGVPMQSIYSIREAEDMLFQRTRELGIAGWIIKNIADSDFCTRTELVYSGFLDSRTSI